MKYAACSFGSQREDDTKTYDYLIPSGVEIAVGDEAIIESRGSEKRVFVRAIKDETTVPADKIKPVLRKAEPRKEETENEGGAE